jgi:hypothetical protein
LDSSLHNSLKDEIKDEYLKSLGLNVFRENDFHIGIKDKLSKLLNYVSSLPDKETDINFSYTLKKIESMNGKFKKRRNLLYFMKPKWRNIVDLLDRRLDDNIINCIVNNENITIHSSISEISKILPSRYKSDKGCQQVINYLKSYGINIKLE